MIITVSQDGVGVEDAHDFRRFSVQVGAEEAAFESVKDGQPSVLRFEGKGVAWVSIAALKGWEGLRDDEAWQAGLDMMIAKAAPHGWVDAERGEIRAHVVWAAG